MHLNDIENRWIIRQGDQECLIRSQRSNGSPPDFMLGTLFLICAVAGGTLFLCLFFLQLLGLGGHHAGMHHSSSPGVHANHLTPGTHTAPAQAGGFRGHLARSLGGKQAVSHVLAHQSSSPGQTGHWAPVLQSWLVTMLSFQGIVTGVTAFGLVGLAAMSQNWTVWLVLPLASLSAIGASLLVASLLHLLLSMDSDGTINTVEAIGSTGSVYLSIPPRNTGIGKVLVRMQGRTMEYSAVTYQPEEIKTGEEIIVVGVQKPGILEVSSASSVPTRIDF